MAKTVAARMREYRQRHLEAVRERERCRRRARYANGWREDPLKKRARNILVGAVRRSRVQRGACEVCGRPNAQAHHDDYSRPLDVRWLCVDHHNELHYPLEGRPRS